MSNAVMRLAPNLVALRRTVVDAWLADKRLMITGFDDGNWAVELLVPDGVEPFDVVDEFLAALMSDGA